MPSGSRLVASSRSPGAARSSGVGDLRGQRRSGARSCPGSAAAPGRRPRPAAAAAARRLGHRGRRRPGEQHLAAQPQRGQDGLRHLGRIGHRRQLHPPHPVRARSASAGPASTESRVLPLPPGPVRVTSRCAAISARTARTSASRPDEAAQLGRQVAPPVRGRSGLRSSSRCRAASSGDGSVPRVSARPAPDATRRPPARGPGCRPARRARISRAASGSSSGCAATSASSSADHVAAGADLPGDRFLARRRAAGCSRRTASARAAPRESPAGRARAPSASSGRSARQAGEAVGVHPVRVDDQAVAGRCGLDRQARRGAGGRPAPAARCRPPPADRHPRPRRSAGRRRRRGWRPGRAGSAGYAAARPRPAPAHRCRRAAPTARAPRCPRLRLSLAGQSVSRAPQRALS